MTQKLEVAEVRKLQETFGIHKINLIYEDGASEGVWATFPTEEDFASYYEETQGVAYKAVLLNYPLGWQGREWGDVIVAITRGSVRSIARWQDNPLRDRRQAGACG